MIFVASVGKYGCDLFLFALVYEVRDSQMCIVILVLLGIIPAIIWGYFVRLVLIQQPTCHVQFCNKITCQQTHVNPCEPIFAVLEISKFICVVNYKSQNFNFKPCAEFTISFRIFILNITCNYM